MREREDRLRKFTKGVTAMLKHTETEGKCCGKRKPFYCGSLGGARRGIGSKAA